TMRREGYELQVSKANVIFKEENGKKLEPMEYLTVDVQLHHQSRHVLEYLLHLFSLRYT
ncbi:hypothetical protein GNF51_16990, partial [Clostridium perfringens]|nr:hypothetical protein [Clostridium perfringens]